MEAEKANTKKRPRSQNWLEEDKILLRGLVIERIGIIENKSTDTITNTKKSEAWIDLCDSFNCMCKGSPRTTVQLKNQWGILKMNDKKQKAFEPEVVCETDGNRTPNTDPLDSEESNDDDDTREYDSDRNRINPKIVLATAEDVATFELQCRRELHRVQFENERKRGRNLALEEVLIKTKTEYYRRKLLALSNNGTSTNK